MDLCEIEVSQGYAVRPCFKKNTSSCFHNTPSQFSDPTEVLMVQEIEPRANCILGKHSPLSYIPWKSAFVGRVLSSSLPINPPGCGHLFGYA